MSVSARTFQLLYIIRQRATQDLPTRLQDFSDFIIDRRKSAPALYSNAYVAPSAIQDLLGRMSIENLVTATDGEYQLEHMGSQMADLLTGIDACSNSFIENYKEAVVKAALEQRARLGQGPATQRDLAATTNISIDSARRGLDNLVASGVVIENTSGRNQTYVLATPPLAATPAPEVVAAPTLDLDLRNIDEPRTLDPDLKAALDNIDNPVPLGAVLQDNGPDVEPPAAVVTQDEAPEAPETPASLPEEPEDLEGQCDPSICSGCDEDVYGESPYDWNEVPVPLRDTLYIQAEAVGMTLSEYLLTLAEAAQNRMLRAINGVEENIIRTLMSEVMNLQRQNANLRFQVNKRKAAGG